MCENNEENIPPEVFEAARKATLNLLPQKSLLLLLLVRKMKWVHLLNCQALPNPHSLKYQTLYRRL
ncbi:unnamed protein product, partial [Tenebrio molitor]